MIRRWPFKVAMQVMAMLCISTFMFAQNSNLILENDPAQRVQIAPESVFKSFREAGMKPVNHPLTSGEKEKVEKAFTHLPPLHQRILKQHLQSISFMDDMPNTALTSPVDMGRSTKMLNITFRASLLDENISQWATWKESTCGKQLPISRAPEIYARLAKTPFPSLYAMAAWYEDIAELATIYHLTSKMKQPFYIVVTKNNVELARFEPMNNALVKARLVQLTTFYKS